MAKTLKNSFVGVLAAVFVFAAFATPAKAQTVAELQAMVNQLMAQIAAMSGGSTTTGANCYVHSATLRVGSTGSQVMALQKALGISADGKFGPMTASAVRSFQSSKGLGADGVVGPMTGAAIASACTPSTGGNTSTGGNVSLNGTEGDLTFDVSLDSDVTIDLGDSEEVIAVDFEAEDGDVMVERVDFMFNKRPWLYFDEVNLLANGKEIASLSSSSDFSEVGSDWRARFSGLKQVVKEDETVEFSLELKVLGSMSGTRDQDIVTVSMNNDSVRFVEGSGVVTTVSDSTLGAISVAVDFEDSFNEGDISLTIGDNSPENAVIVLDEDARTSEVTVLEFTAEAEDDDLTVNDVTLVLSTSDSSVADTVYRAFLYNGSKLLKSKSVSGTTVIFDDVDFDIDEDEEEDFTVKLEFNKAENLTLGNLVVVSVEVDAENSDFGAENDTLSVNETHQLIVEGLVDTYDTKSATTRALGDDTIGVFTFEFDLTAYERDFFIAESGAGFGLTIDVGAGTTAATLVDVDSNATLVGGTAYRINKGQTRTFTLKVEVAATATGTPQSARVTVDDLTFYTDSALDAGADTLDLGAPDYRSAQVSIIDAN